MKKKTQYDILVSDVHYQAMADAILEFNKWYAVRGQYIKDGELQQLSNKLNSVYEEERNRQNS